MLKSLCPLLVKDGQWYGSHKVNTQIIWHNNVFKMMIVAKPNEHRILEGVRRENGVWQAVLTIILVSHNISKIK